MSGGTKLAISLTVNKRQVNAEVEARLLLIDFLRRHAKTTGPHIGCEEGLCGACTIDLDGETVKACMVLAVQADGSDITTVEGLADGGELATLQTAFSECHALQCGYCTPGMLMSARALLANNADPTETEIRSALQGNLCRCTGYQNIVLAVQLAATKGRSNGNEISQ
jgi:carbon-monoxide dehydrogenase small subunit